jgi:hypothetical protein
MPDALRQIMPAARSNPREALILLSLVDLCAPLGAPATESKRLVILHSFGRDVAPYNVIVAGFRAELSRAASGPHVA